MSRSGTAIENLLQKLAKELNTDSDTLRDMIFSSGEELVPNYFETGADGSVTAVFPGGIKIPELVPQVTLNEDKQISWVRNTDGALVAQVRSATFVGSQEFDFFTQNPDDNSVQAGLVAISAIATSGGSQTYAFSSDDVPRSELRNIINSDGRSHFMQTPVLGRYKVHFGVVNSLGVYSQGNLGPGDSWSRTGVGRYRITWANAGSIYFGIVNSFQGAFVPAAWVFGATTTTADVAIDNVVGPAVADSVFMYLFIRDA